MPMTDSSRSIAGRDYLVFGVGTCLLVVITHAVAYMTHEYSHSFVAWGLGWMRDPLALDYGKPTLYNILFLGDVGDNVQYDPIFASGNGLVATTIALAGTAIGNALLYFACYRVSKFRGIASNWLALSIVYWLALMCAGNVWGYVPIRALTTHADIALSAKGLGISPWLQFPFLIVPALYVVYHFFTKMCASSLMTVSGGSSAKLALVIALTGYWFFAFYGGDGTSGDYGHVSQILAILSKYILFPLSTLWLWSQYGAETDARVLTPSSTS
jgi:hypothetical protein